MRSRIQPILTISTFSPSLNPTTPLQTLGIYAHLLCLLDLSSHIQNRAADIAWDGVANAVVISDEEYASFVWSQDDDGDSDGGAAAPANELVAAFEPGSV